MRNIIICISLLAMICFSANVLAAEAPKTAPAKPAPAKAAPVNPATAPGKAAAAAVTPKPMVHDVIFGEIVSVDKAKGQIVVKDKNGQKTITAKPGEIAKLKKGDRVKIALEAGTNKAVKIRPEKPVKRPAKKPVKPVKNPDKPAK